MKSCLNDAGLVLGGHYVIREKDGGRGFTGFIATDGTHPHKVAFVYTGFDGVREDESMLRSVIDAPSHPRWDYLSTVLRKAESMSPCPVPSFWNSGSMDRTWRRWVEDNSELFGLFHGVHEDGGCIPFEQIAPEVLPPVSYAEKKYIHDNSLVVLSEYAQMNYGRSHCISVGEVLRVKKRGVECCKLEHLNGAPVMGDWVVKFLMLARTGERAEKKAEPHAGQETQEPQEPQAPWGKHLQQEQIICSRQVAIDNKAALERAALEELDRPMRPRYPRAQPLLTADLLSNPWQRRK